MAITLSELPRLNAAYSNNFILNAKSDVVTDATYIYEFNIYLDSIFIGKYNFTPSPVNLDATIDLSAYISKFFVSEVYTTTGSTINEFIPESVKDVLIEIKVYDVDNIFVDNKITPTYYVANSAINISEGQTLEDYIMIYPDTTAYFLSNWKTDKSITINDYANLTSITGDFGSGIIGEYFGVLIKTYKDNQFVDSIFEQLPHPVTPRSLVNINVSPFFLNNIQTDFITDDVDYYTVEEVNGFSTLPQRINLIKNYKHEKHYNFNYLNRLGGNDTYTVMLNNVTTDTISKNVLEQFTNQKIYNIDVNEEITVLTQFMTYQEAYDLKELFTSNAVRVFDGTTTNDVIVKNTGVEYRGKYPKTTIQYQIKFKNNNKYFTQQY